MNRMWVQAHLMCYVEAEHEGQDEHAAGAVPHDSDQVPEDLQLEVIETVLSHHILQHCLRPCVQVLLHILHPASHCTVVNANQESLFAQGMDTKIGTHHPHHLPSRVHPQAACRLMVASALWSLWVVRASCKQRYFNECGHRDHLAIWENPRLFQPEGMLRTNLPELHLLPTLQTAPSSRSSNGQHWLCKGPWQNIDDKAIVTCQRVWQFDSNVIQADHTAKMADSPL